MYERNFINRGDNTMYVSPETVINSANDAVINATRTFVSAQKSYMDVMVDNFEQALKQSADAWSKAAEQVKDLTPNK